MSNNQLYNLKNYLDNNNIDIKKLYHLKIKYILYLNSLSNDKLDEFFKDNNNIKNIKLKIKENIKDKKFNITEKEFKIIEILFNDIIYEITYELDDYYDENIMLYKKYFYNFTIKELLYFTEEYYDALYYYCKKYIDNYKDKFKLIYNSYINEKKKIKNYKDNTINNKYDLLKYYIGEYIQNVPDNDEMIHPDSYPIDYCKVFHILPHLSNGIYNSLDELNKLINDLQKENEELKNKLNIK